MRFTIKGLMWVVAVAAGLLTFHVQFLATYFPVWILAIPCVFLLAGCCLWTWRCRRLATLGFGGVSILGNSLYALASICPDYMVAPMLKLGWIIVLLPAIGALGAAWAKRATENHASPRRSPFICWLLVVVLAILPAFTFSTVWPLRLAFLASRTSLDRLADRAEAGHVIRSLHRIGPFRLIESHVDQDSKTVGLFIDPNPSGRSGFVRVHSKTLEGQRFASLIGTDTNVELGWGWSYRQDD